MPFVDGPSRTFQAAAAITLGVLVKVDSSGYAAIAGLGEQPIGVAETAAAAAGDKISIRLLHGGGTFRAKASGAFAVGALVYGRASGLVDDISTTSAVLVGVALEAATAANDLVEVAPV